MKRRILSAVTAVLLLVSLLPAAALAADGVTAVPEDRMEIYTIQGVTGEITDGRAVYTVESKENTSDWTQNSGEGSDQTYTYVGLYITMPENAVSLKYSDEGNREEMTQVPAGSDFLQGGRFQHWFPVAYETEDGGFGLFYGGRTYTLLLDWYDADNQLIKQEQVTVQRSLADSLAVAQVGDYTYATLADAVDAAQSGDTIILLANCSAEDIVINKGITLNLNGKTVTAAGGSGKDAFYVMLGGDLNLTGSGAIAATGLTRPLTWLAIPPPPPGTPPLAVRFSPWALT